MDEGRRPPEKMEGAAPNQAIVAFIDILGYGDLVNRLINDFEAIKSIQKLLKGVSVDHIETIRKKLSLPDPYDEYSKQLLNLINVRYISDTILVTLPFSDKEISSPHFNPSEILSHCVFSYLYFIAMACIQFIGLTGLVVRGGISMGPHYENQHNGNLFIFSKAFINAYKLEGKACSPRILIDDQVLDFVKGLPLEELHKFIFVDSSGNSCLDTYTIFENEPRSPVILSGIKEGVSRNMFKNRQNKLALALIRR